jgi:catechol 2,3-dioxygenase-like lactoylglutathione lyase family enzyme
MPLRRLDHTLVLTDDIEETMAFYRDVLGFEVGDRPPLPFPGYWLYLDGVASLHVAERAAYETHAATLGVAPKGSPVDHVAFEADGRERLLDRLAAAGVDVTTNVVPGAGIRQLFFDDPNGARIELIVSD